MEWYIFKTRYHALMSFLGTIGHLMEGSGLEELIESSYGWLPIILNGKSWPNAMRSFRMVVAALLHDLINLEEKSFKEIKQSLENDRNHPTGKLLV